MCLADHVASRLPYDGVVVTHSLSAAFGFLYQTLLYSHLKIRPPHPQPHPQRRINKETEKIELLCFIILHSSYIIVISDFSTDLDEEIVKCLHFDRFSINVSVQRFADT